MDLQLIQSELEKERESGFRIAQRVYQEGAFSRPVAELILDEPLEFTIPAGSEIIGPAVDGDSFALVKGTAHVKAREGDTVLEVLYDIRDDQQDYVQCQAGANPDPFIAGCKLPTTSLMIFKQNRTIFSFVKYRLCRRRQHTAS